MRLITFGGLSIEGAPSGLGGAAGQRRPLALLLVLADAGERGTSRDKVASFLWSESDRERSRSALRQTLYAIRRDLQQPEVVVGSADLRLNTSILSSDLMEFDQAMRTGDLKRMASLYTGTLADGFFLTGAPEFERWLEGAQRERAGQFAKAVRQLAKDAEASGDKHAAVEYWRRLAEHDPFSSEISIKYMEALAEVGEPTQALQYAQKYEEAVREEFGVAPDAAVLRVVERIRTPPHGKPVFTRVAADAANKSSVRIQSPFSGPATATVADLIGPERRPKWSRRSVLWVGLASVVIAVGALIAYVARPRSPSAPDPSLLAVVPYQPLDSGLTVWNEGVADLLAHSLDGREGLRAVPFTSRPWAGHSDEQSAHELARQTGAGTVVYGSIRRAGDDSVKVVTSVLRVQANRTFNMEHQASLKHVDRLIDSLATAVASQVQQWLVEESRRGGRQRAESAEKNIRRF